MLPAGLKKHLIAVGAALLLWAVCAPSASAAPANDDFVNAQDVGDVNSLPVSVPASNVGATAEAGEPAIFGSPATRSVWFKWFSFNTTSTVVDLCQAGFTGGGSDPGIAVWTGNSVSGLTLVAQNTNSCRVRFFSGNGTTYRIQVDYRNGEGAFNFGLRRRVVPPNDLYSNPTVVGPALPVTVAGSTIDADFQPGEPAIWNGSSSSSVWYSWTATDSRQVHVDFCDSFVYSGAGNHAIGIFSGTNLITAEVLYVDRFKCSTNFDAVAGQNYRIGYTNHFGGEANFVFRLTDAPRPPNDDFNAAITVGPALPVDLTASNDFATVETGEPEHAGTTPFGSVWYRWTPSQSSRVRLSACSPDFPARIGIYIGTAVGTLSSRGEAPGFNSTCARLLNAVAGQTYMIAASGSSVDGGTGEFRLEIRPHQTPANDDFANAQTLGPALPVTATGTTADATPESGERSHHPPPNANQEPSVWYRWTPAASAPVTISVCDPSAPVDLGVYAGDVVFDLELRGQSSDACPNGSGGLIRLDAQAGSTYRIAVAVKDRNESADFTLRIEGPPDTGGPGPGDPPLIDPDKPGFNLKRAINKCKKKFRGKSKRMKRKRATCIRRAKLKAAVIKCRKIEKKAPRQRCVRKARRKFSPPGRAGGRSNRPAR